MKFTSTLVLILMVGASLFGLVYLATSSNSPTSKSAMASLPPQKAEPELEDDIDFPDDEVDSPDFESPSQNFSLSNKPDDVEVKVANESDGKLIEEIIAMPDNNLKQSLDALKEKVSSESFQNLLENEKTTEAEKAPLKRDMERLAMLRLEKSRRKHKDEEPEGFDIRREHVSNLEEIRELLSEL